ncbi:hypothetical protein [Candidatus Oscillochloris fontis]|uniref:hypothetical protein n=1 Tax=Candidatus Oscillochloris fontis TaxID=2496868 RepID=UPI0013763F66|nr:hypothetical protein [Candidatus Oscillochloris fontis]
MDVPWASTYGYVRRGASTSSATAPLAVAEPAEAEPAEAMRRSQVSPGITDPLGHW